MEYSCLLTWPVAAPAFFSDTWRNTWLYEMESYTASEIPYANFDIFDGSKHATFEPFINQLCLKHYDIIFLIAPIDCLDGFLKSITYIKQISPSSKIFAYGYATVLKPDFFKNLDIDALPLNGYFELAVKSYVDYQLSGAELNNVVIKESSGWKSYSAPVENMKWNFIRPEYIADWDVVRLTVARGCVGNCPFCIASKLHGCRENRKSVDEVLEYIRVLQDLGYGEKPIELGAPSFTYNKAWVIELCERIISTGYKLDWRCVTRVDMLDPDLLQLMSKAGCRRIGIGVETLNAGEQHEIRKPIKEAATQQVLSWMTDNGIEPLVYLMVGLPTQTYDSIIYTIETVTKWKGKPRLTAYLDYTKLDYSDPLKVAVESNMTTSSLQNFTETQRRKLLLYITGSADRDTAFLD